MNMDSWSTARLLNTAARLRERHENERLSANGLTHAGAILLRVLGTYGSLSQVDLARLLHIQPQTAGRTLERLEAQGLVHRVRGDADRRVIQVAATTAGRDLLGAVDAEGARFDEATGLADRELRTCLEEIILSIRPNAFKTPRTSTSTYR